MYEELVKRLREAPNDWPDADLHYEAADAIEELQRTQMSSAKWIPVEERLPKAYEYDARGYSLPYLVMNGWMRVTARRTKDYWVLFGNGTVLEYVTHWMPLPEPPKEET